MMEDEGHQKTQKVKQKDEEGTEYTHHTSKEITYSIILL